MISYIMNMMKYLFIVVISISLINGFPEPLGVQTRMRISGSLDHLCENDSGGSDELPSCECLKQFAVQGDFLVGDFEETVEANLFSEFNLNDVVERLYSTNRTVNETLITKVSGLECIDESGSKTELNTIYSYLINYRTTVGAAGGGTLLTVGSPPPGNPSPEPIGILYVDDMNEDNAAVITDVVVTINDTKTIEFDDLGKICHNDHPPRSLEAFLWNIANKVVLNSSNSCDVPKDTYYPLYFYYMPAVFALNEPLLCGEYSISMTVRPETISYEIVVYLMWNLPYRIYCAYLEEE